MAQAQDANAPATDIASLITSHVRDVPDYPQPGVVFKDITPLLAEPKVFGTVIDALAASFGPVDKVVGIEARGFILAAPVAYQTGAGFVPVRKQGKLPSATFSREYKLEYGTAIIEVHQDAFKPGDRVLIVDDVLATGGTAGATASLVRQCAAEVVGIAVLMELSFLNGRSALSGLDVRALLTVLARGDDPRRPPAHGAAPPHTPAGGRPPEDPPRMEGSAPHTPAGGRPPGGPVLGIPRPYRQVRNAECLPAS